jgi:hypothetical protein
MPAISNEGSSTGGDWKPKVPQPGPFPSKSLSNLSLRFGSATPSITGGSKIGSPAIPPVQIPTDNAMSGVSKPATPVDQEASVSGDATV